MAVSAMVNVPAVKNTFVGLVAVLVVPSLKTHK
jgi:hypothetical protein